jgi:hypothetical protein
LAQGHITNQSQTLSARIFNQPDGIFQTAILAAIKAGDVRPALRKSERDALTNATARAGYQGNGAGQIEKCWGVHGDIRHGITYLGSKEILELKNLFFTAY